MLTEQEQFFYDNAPFSYHPATETEEQGRERCARELAAAEKRLNDGPYYITTEPDPEPWQGDQPYDGPLWIVSLWSVDGRNRPLLLGSLGQIDEQDGGPYFRVVAAELAEQYIPR